MRLGVCALRTIFRTRVLKLFSSFKESFTFVDKIRKTGVPRDGCMSSFDVVNLFTSVPLAEVIVICADASYTNDEIERVTTTLS